MTPEHLNHDKNATRNFPFMIALVKRSGAWASGELLSRGYATGPVVAVAVVVEL